MSTSDALREIWSEARPYIEQQLEIAEVVKGFREAATAKGLEWSTVKAMIKARIEDEKDGKERMTKLLEKAEFALGYADMLGLGNMNEQNFIEAVEGFPEHDAETGEITEPQTAPPAAQMPAVTAESPSTNGHATSLDRAEGIADGQPIHRSAHAEAHGTEAYAVPSLAVDSVPATTDGDASAGGENEAVVEIPADGQNSASSGKSVEAPASAAPPAFITKLRPHCRQPFACGGSGPKHCWKCEQAAAEKASAA